MSRSHPFTNPSKDPNDPFARLFGGDERPVPRPEFRAALRQHLVAFVPPAGIPIDAPLLGRVVLRPVHALIGAALGVAAVAGVLALQPGNRSAVDPPPVEQPAVRSADHPAPAAASVPVRRSPNEADRRATIAARGAADRTEARGSAASSAASSDDVVPAAAPVRRPPVADASAADVGAPPALPEPAEEARIVPPPDPAASSSDHGRDRDRDRDRNRPATATATTAAADPSSGAAPTEPARLPPEPAEPTQAPPAAMPTVPVAPTPGP